MRLPFMKETWSMVLPVLGAAILLVLWGVRSQRTWALALGSVLIVVAALMLNFFRDFERPAPGGLGPKTVLSPADGLITIVREVQEPMHLKKKALQIAIFMNPLDNHVQRAPVDGRVVGKDYYPGEYLAAYADKADLVNEQAHLVVQPDKPAGSRKPPGLMVIKQIAGMLCHRVKTDEAVGDRIARGQRIGRILLGSRVDLFLPLGSKSLVKVGDRVLAGQTPLGELP